MNIINRKYFNIIAIITAIVVTLITSVQRNEVGGNFIFIFILIFIGYLFGELTCHFHSKNKGFILTLGIFILFNLAHSAIDGLNWSGNIIPVLLHEIVRQPVLFLLLWELLVPFTEIKKNWKILACILSVSGVWIVGLLLGASVTGLITSAENLDKTIGLFIFLLIGDLIHHLIEELRKDGKKETCDHIH